MGAEDAQENAGALLQMAENLLRLMQRDSENGSTETVDRGALAIADLVKAREFPAERAAEFRERATLCQRYVYQRSAETLLIGAEKLARVNDEKGRNETLTKAREHVARAIQHGVDDTYRRGVERRIEALMLTDAGGVDPRTREAARRRLEVKEVASKAPGGIERRRAIRYVNPALAVTISGSTYATVNWSILGVLLEQYRGEHELKAGDRIRVDLSCAELNVAGEQAARVVRVGHPAGTLALSFPEISTVVLTLARAMKEEGISAEPEQ